MRIALTHNLQLSDAEEEAEFDRPDTIQALVAGLEKLGHDVEPIEVSGPASRTVARLEALNPDLVFNTAEGKRGRFREAFYPALFENLGIPCTGSDAYVCALTLDKQLTKLVVERAGIPTPTAIFVDEPGPIDVSRFHFPVIVKPNYEGSSKGITVDSIVEEPARLEPYVRELLARYPTGLLVEDFVIGRDITVPFLEVAQTPADGVLSCAEYIFDPAVVGGRKYQLYDYELKQKLYNAVEVRVPAELDPALATQIQQVSRKAFKILGVRDLGRIDYRLTPDGRFYFLEVNALPSLEPGAGIYVAAALAGLGTVESVLDAVIRSAAKRHGLQVTGKPSRRKSKQLRVGLTFNLKRHPPSNANEDAEAEYDAPKTIAAIREAITSYGHDVVELEAVPELARLVQDANVDVVFNIAEGIRGRNRESQVPALLELFDIPYTGSDPATLSLALDKGLAKRVVKQAGVATPDWVVMTTGREKLPKGVDFPVIVKPVAEGSSKGVFGTSVARTDEELREIVAKILTRYDQGALVEEFLPGREFTVGLLGERRPKVLPPMEIVFVEPKTAFPVYTFEHKLDFSKEIRNEVPANLEPPLLKELERCARTVFMALGCRDVARIDLRLDGGGRVNFIECNPLPGLTPDFSDLCLISRAAGLDYRGLIGEILAPAIRRLRERDRRRERSRSDDGGERAGV